MQTPDWIWYAFAFAFGSCIGSFLNVVIYRMPRDLSLVRPPSACPACGRHIQFYDNIPLVSYLLLRARCRYCKAFISPRYFTVELLAAIVFTGLAHLFFRSDWRGPVEPFLEGGWVVWMAYAVLLSGLIAASGIDLKLMVIPLSICWFVTAAGLAAGTLAPLLVDMDGLAQSNLLPTASPNTGAMAVGAAIGLGLSWLLVSMGLVKRSYDESGGCTEFNDRAEILKEILFLSPVIICSLAAVKLCQMPVLADFWAGVAKVPALSGLLGSLWGYFIGCAVVWFTRILGTLAFNKEAMGLGDVHLMGAAGTVIGAVSVTTAFFVAPFLGLAWGMFQLLFRKEHQIPYGPFLSMGVAAVIIFHDFIMSYLLFAFKG